MYVFWWTGRGYLVFAVLVASLTVFGLLVAAGMPDSPWLWASAFLVAAAVNWRIGSKINHKKLASLKPNSLKDRLLYKARHRFMSLPMETFSIVIAIGGIVVLIV